MKDNESTGGIILSGGKSRRMGRPKVMLPFGPETMLARVVRLLGEAVDQLVVVAGVGQELPQLPSGVLVVHDRQPDLGPLEGLAVGLGATEAEAAFVTGCDVPLLLGAFVRRMIELSAGYEIAVPHVDVLGKGKGKGAFDHPLAAVYRRSVLPRIEALLAAGRMRPAYLFDQVRTRRVTAEELTDVDPQLQSLANVNSPADYHAALAREAEKL